MIIKAYIRNHLFHLPRNQNDLTEQVKEKLYNRKKLIKSGISKMYPITKLETKNNETKIEHSKDLNIFLLNIYLLYLESKGIDYLSNIQIKLSNDNIYQSLKNEIEQVDKHTTIEETEKIVLDHIETSRNNKEKSFQTQNVFNMDWVINMDKKLRE